MAELAKSAKGRYGAVLKAAKAAGIDTDDITANIKLRHLDRNVLIQKERSRARMMAVCGLWPKIQGELFAKETPQAAPTVEDTVETAYDRGHQCGVKGELRTVNPYNAGTEQWAEFDRGWSVGQEKNVPGRHRAKATKRKANLKLVGGDAALDAEGPEPPLDPLIA